MASRLTQVLKVLVGLLLTATVAALIGFVVVTYRNRQRDSPPNIIIFIADDLGWDDVSFHGNDQIPTPNLDAFASHGVILNSLYSAPQCTPSRGALLTGKLPLHIGLHEFLVLSGVYGSGLSLNHKLMPEYLRDMGYETHLIGKWHLGFYKESLLPTRRGFDSHYGHYSGAGSYYGHLFAESDFIPLGVPAGYDLHKDGAPEFSGYGQYVTDLYDRRFREVVKHKSDKPLLIVLSHMAAHGNYPGDLLQVPESAYNGADFAHIHHKQRKKFAGLVKTVDDSFGRTVEVLAENGLLENSVILFMSDNGGPSFKAALYNTGSSNWPFRGHKFTPWQGAMRVPSFIWSPLIKDAPYVNNKLYHFADVLPTLYRLAGGNLTDLKEIDGKDMWASISDEGVPSPRDELLLVYDRYSTIDYAGYAAIMGRYKLVSGNWAFNDLNNYYLAAGDRLNSVNELERRRLISKAHSVLRDRGLDRNITSNWRDQAVIRCSWDEHLRCNDDPCDNTTMVSPTGGDYLEVEVKPVNETFKCDFTHEPCLFDLQTDPCETVNVAEIYPDIFQKLKDFINTFEAEEPTTSFDYRACYDRKANPARKDPPIWEPWAKGCDGLLDEECPHKLIRNESSPCPPGGDIQHEPTP